MIKLDMQQYFILMKNMKFFDKIRYLYLLKISISDVYSHEHMEIKTYSDDDLPLEKTNHAQFNNAY